MPHQIGYVDNSGGALAHYKMLETIKDFASANGWTVLRYDTSQDEHELILRGVGYSGTEEIFVGFATYQSADNDYYNILAAAFTGYVSSLSFYGQPGVVISGVPAHNQRIDYWLTLNPQRIALAMKIGTPVYESAYVGKLLPYGLPSQYPYPMVCGGMLNGKAATRYSDTAHSMPYRGARAGMQLRNNSGWVQPHCYPYGNAFLAGAGTSESSRVMRDTGGTYHLIPFELHDNVANLWGALDGIFYISGFDNVVENTLVIDDVTYVVIQDVYRTGFTDYYAMRLDD